MSDRAIVSRAEAKAAGLKRYRTGVECSKGHDAERRVGNRLCVVCHAEASRLRREADPDRQREYDRQYRQANAEQQREYAREYRKANAEKLREYDHQYRKANASKRLAYVRLREARKLQATPGWFDKAAVEAIYHEAARLSIITSVEHQVDHIIPLRGKNVCGLHVQNNLMAVPRDWNQSKSAKLIEDYDEWLLELMLQTA